VLLGLWSKTAGLGLEVEMPEPVSRRRGAAAAVAAVAVSNVTAAVAVDSSESLSDLDAAVEQLPPRHDVMPGPVQSPAADRPPRLTISSSSGSSSDSQEEMAKTPPRLRYRAPFHHRNDARIIQNKVTASPLFSPIVSASDQSFNPHHGAAGSETQKVKVSTLQPVEGPGGLERGNLICTSVTGTHATRSTVKNTISKTANKRTGGGPHDSATNWVKTAVQARAMAQHDDHCGHCFLCLEREQALTNTTTKVDALKRANVRLQARLQAQLTASPEVLAQHKEAIRKLEAQLTVVVPLRMPCPHPVLRAVMHTTQSCHPL